MVSGLTPAWKPPTGMDPRVVGQWRAFYSNVQREYGITAAQYRDLYIAQHGCCYICRTAKGKHPDDPKGRGGRRLAVDHNHVTGAVRGLLCSGSESANTCNRLIARYSIYALQRAVDYLQEEPAQIVLSRSRGLDDRVPDPLDQDRDTIISGVLGLK